MDKIRSALINFIDLVISLVKGTEYVILISLTPILEPVAKVVLFRLCQIRINGNRSWDIQVKNRKFYARVAAYGSLGFGESYVDGWIELDDIEAVSYRIAQSGLANFEQWIPHHKVLHYLRFHWLNLQGPERSETMNEPFYNKGVEYFNLFLENPLSDTQAYWKNGAKDLAQANQENFKILAKKLDLHPGMRVLEIGCGFGALTQYIGKNYDVNLFAITDAKTMAKVAQKECLNLPNVQIQLMHWQHVSGKYDRIVCNERLPHVGYHNLDTFFKKISKLLKLNGKFVLQDIEAKPGQIKTDEYLAKYVFPDHYMPTLSEVIYFSTKYLDLIHFEDISEDSLKTLRAMVQNLKKSFKGLHDKEIRDIYKPTLFNYACQAGAVNGGLVVAHHLVFTSVKACQIPYNDIRQ